MEFRTITATREGVCKRCGQTFPVGTKVRYAGGDNIYHFKADCPAAADPGPKTPSPAPPTPTVDSPVVSTNGKCMTAIPIPGEPPTKAVSVVCSKRPGDQNKFRVAILHVHENEADGVTVWRVCQYISPATNNWNDAVKEAKTLADKHTLPLHLMLIDGSEFKITHKQRKTS